MMEFEKIKYLAENNIECSDYFNDQTDTEKKKVLNKMKNLENYRKNVKPYYFQILDMNIPLEQKSHILKKLTISQKSHDNSKIKGWINKVFQIPFGINVQINYNGSIKKYLNNIKKKMDDVVLGHTDAKRQIIQIMAQEIKNPNGCGNIIGLWGPPGNGKTTLIKEGIAKAMNRPFEFISLGGATDSSFLEGHSYTYEGSIPGRIAMALIKAKCMNPIIYFDELDKISNTAKGNEIVNMLIHMTDPSQNSCFTDKYFHGLTFDLSKVTFIFSFNDKTKIDRVLADRITLIETKYLLISQKINIVKNYMLPLILNDMKLKPNTVKINDNIIRYLITNYTLEGGVRKLKQLLYNIVRELNIYNLTETKLIGKKVKFPFIIKKPHLDIIFKNRSKIDYDKKSNIDDIGIVNGLYAMSSFGVGGILPIEAVFTPAVNPLALKLTGSLENVIKESIEIATTKAWNLTSKTIRDLWNTKWKKNKMGFHVHCPDGATPKDGPSAGLAFTVAIYSLLNNIKIKSNVAMTGEINLQGKALKIGGLEEKLEGAKRAGISLVLIPEENTKDLEVIKMRNPSLVDSKFEVKKVKNIIDVLKYSLVENTNVTNNWIKEL